jgi:hypothetical protein
MNTDKIIINLIFLPLFFAGCNQKMGQWKDFYSSQLWYQQEKAKEKRFTGKVYDKGEVKWIVESEPGDTGGIIPREKEKEVMYKKGENKTRYLFKTRVTAIDLFIDSFWKEMELENELGGKKGLGEKRVEIIGKIIKEKVTVSEKERERNVLIPGKIRVAK